MKTSRTGNGLLLVLIFVTIFTFLIYSISGLIDMEMRKNMSAEIRYEAQQAADSLLQSGMAQLKSISVYSLEDEFELNHQHLGSEFNLDPDQSSIIGFKLQPSVYGFVNDVDNDFSGATVQNMYAHTSFITLLSRATVERDGQTTVAYARRYMQILEASFFNYGMLAYNEDLELYPGSNMTQGGLLHGNKGVYMSSNATLTLTDNVTYTGDFNQGPSPVNGKGDSNGEVIFQQGEPQQVAKRELPGFEIADNGNDGYRIIQPTLSHPQLTAGRNAAEGSAERNAYEKRKEAESQKFAYKAGLTISVDNNGAVTYYTYARNSDGTIDYDVNGYPKKIELIGNTNIAKESSRLYDYRHESEVRIIDLDISHLKTHVEQESAWVAAGNNADAANKKPAAWWNGIVYVEFPQKQNTPARDDEVVPAIDGWGLKLVNGGTLPKPQYSKILGTTIATNQMMYVKGNYNADGKVDTGSSTRSDTVSETGHDHFSGDEIPAALVADSVTFLSGNWQDDYNADTPLDNRLSSPFNEVSAAILAGIVPSHIAGDKKFYSGGMENFPRMLEHWGNGQRNLRIRGSMIVMYRSEVGNKRWGKRNVYKKPQRNWGYHEGFRFRGPVGAPQNVDTWSSDNNTAFASNFSFLTEAEYNAHLNELRTNLNSTTFTGISL